MVDGPLLDPYAAEAPRTNRAAVWSLALASLGFVCLVGVGGLLGVALGVLARGEISRSNGRQTGRGLANGGIALGLVNVAACVAGLAALIAYAARPKPPPPTYASPAPLLAPPAATPSARARAAPAAGAGAASRDDGVVVSQVGALTLVDLGPDVRSLRAALDEQRSLAQKAGEKLLLWLVVERCRPCNGVAVSLPDPALQRALAGVRLVRLNARDFALELGRLRMPLDRYPGFALLDADDRPIDYIDGGEWDEDIAPNIAPVLGKFVGGTYTKRREPWNGGSRDDETPL
ncbi:MAG: DUF4190 domain-containing protein [Sorangiineae bacterium]|nr:DUF4190 domain-containing protein [Polyangiaceae bacterium]MEB2322500.1 DUF4190 domain-containing protein [Sorangiineae bacterium]